MPALSAQTIRINEFISSNSSTLKDENGDSPDWIELFNTGPQPVDLTGFGLSDDKDRPFRWTFKTVVIDPGQFLIVFASGKDRQPESVPSLAPRGVTGLKVWLRSDAIATNDPTQIRRSGNNLFLKRWPDQSGQHNDAQQNTDSQQPLFIPNSPSLSQKPTLRFDGLNDLLRLNSSLAQNNFSIFALFKTPVRHEIDPENNSSVGGVSGQRYLLGAAHGGDLEAGAGLSVGTNGVSAYEHGSSYMPALAVYDGPIGTNFTLVTLTYANRQPSLFIQGNLARTGLGSLRPLVRAPVEIGSGSYGAFQGELAEVIIYDRALDAVERRGVEQYLAGKYSIPLPKIFHANFSINNSGEWLVLTAPNGQRLDSISPVNVPRDVSYGRQPDGTPDLFFFNQPTPGAPNRTPASSEFLPPPDFSDQGGFYANSFPLQLHSENPTAQIRYTLDGSEPTDSSPLYTAPLLIRNRAGTPNNLSKIPTVPNGLVPQTEMFKGWVVRARTFKPGALPSTTVTRTFWVDPKGRARYTLPIVALATDRANFFDPTIGIYVPGSTPGGNYSQRGPDWERPVHVEFYATNNTLGFAQEADAKIHGNTSQNFPIKGLDLDGTGAHGHRPFQYRIFPNRPRDEFEHFLLRPTGHDQPMAFMRDELMQSLAAETGAESQAHRLCILFINGEYWGLHYLKEKEDAEFVAFYGQTAADQIDYLEGYAAAKTGDTLHYTAMIDYVATHDLAQPEFYSQITQLIDPDNYIDYKVLEIFNYRWDIGNHRLWRPRTPEGRWRWLQFDNDVGWGGFWAEQPAWQFNMLLAVLTPSRSLHDHNNETTTFLLPRLLKNPEFKRNFINRFADLLNTALLPSHTVNRVNELAAALAPEMAEHIQRWRSPSSLTMWQNNVQYLRTYATNRPPFARQHLLQQFKLPGTAQISLAVNNPAFGAIKLNSLTLTPTTNAPWSGLYFRGNPVTVTAVAAPGFKFDRWHGLFGVDTNSVLLLLNSDLTLTALFKPDIAAPPTFAPPVRVADSLVQFSARGSPNVTYALQCSSNLVDWLTLKDITFDNQGAALWTQPTAPTYQFFRLSIAPR